MTRCDEELTDGRKMSFLHDGRGKGSQQWEFLTLQCDQKRKLKNTV